MADVQAVCTSETFRPHPSEAVRWWEADDWEAARDANEGVWPQRKDHWTWWSEEEWHGLYSEGYRYCAMLVDGRAVATAGLWPRTDEAWEVIAVVAAPGHRNKGYGKAVVSFVTQEILDAGKDATLSTHEKNTPMRRVAAALGYEAR